MIYEPEARHESPAESIRGTRSIVEIASPVASDPPTLPLSLAQMDFASPLGSVSASVRFKGELSLPALRRALAFVTRRHEGLRMRVVRFADRVLQRIVDAVDSYALEPVSVSDFAAAEERIAACLRSPFDLEKHGPLRMELMSVGPDDYVLLLVIHTVAVDRHSVKLLLEELLVSYDCYARNEEPRLPPAMRYTDYVLGEARYGQKLSDSQVEHWRSVLGGNRYPIPRRNGGSGLSGGTWKVAASSITSTEAQRVQELSSAANTTMPAALYGALFLAVSALYSATDVVATVCYSARDTRQLQSLVAKTARRFPLLVSVDRAASLAEFVKTVHSAYMRGAIASRAPFTPGRAAAQALAVGTREPPEEAAHRSGVRLVIVDQEMPKQELECSLPRLTAERVLMGKRPYEGMAPVEVASSAADDLLMISLMRDPAMTVRRPVVFVGTFLSHVIAEGTVRRLVDTTWAIARTMCRENLHTTIADVFARLPAHHRQKT